MCVSALPYWLTPRRAIPASSHEVIPCDGIERAVSWKALWGRLTPAGPISHNGRAPRRSGAAMASQVEVDPQETREWLEALDAVVASDGPQRAQFLLERVVGHAQLTGAAPAPAGATPDLNTNPPPDEPPPPPDQQPQRRGR